MPATNTDEELEWPKRWWDGSNVRVARHALARAGRAGSAKNVVMDQRKLDAARRALGVDTETEAIDLALDFVAFRREVAHGIGALRRAGGVDDVFEARRRV